MTDVFHGSCKVQCVLSLNYALSDLPPSCISLGSMSPLVIRNLIYGGILSTFDWEMKTASSFYILFLFQQDCLSSLCMGKVSKNIINNSRLFIIDIRLFYRLPLTIPPEGYQSHVKLQACRHTYRVNKSEELYSLWIQHSESWFVLKNTINHQTTTETSRKTLSINIWKQILIMWSYFDCDFFCDICIYMYAPCLDFIWIKSNQITVSFTV